MPTAFVTGGSGFIGGALIRRLRGEGWAVRALARSRGAASGTVARSRRRAGARRPRRRRGDDRGRAGRRRRLPRRGAPGRSGAARGVRARQRRGHARTRWPPPARGGRGRFVHVGTEAALMRGEPLVDGRRAARRCARTPGALQRDQGAGRAGRAARPTARTSRPSCCARGWSGGSGRHDDPARRPRRGRGRALGVDRRRPPPDVDDARRQRGRGAVARRDAGARGGVYFVTDGEPVVFRDFVTRLLATQGVDPAAETLPRRRGGGALARGGRPVARCCRCRAAAADAAGLLAGLAGVHHRHHPRAHRAGLRAGHDHRRRNGGAATCASRWDLITRASSSSSTSRTRCAQAGHDVVDVGTDSEESTHYPLFAEPAARLVADGEASAACSSAARASASTSSPTRSTASARSTPTTPTRRRWPASTTTSTS